MRELRNNAYVYSKMCNNYGEILISRTRDGACEGNDIFEYLKIDDDELEFLNTTFQYAPDHPKLLLCKRNGEYAAVLTCGLSSLESSMEIAVEMFADPMIIVNAIIRSGEDKILISNSARRLACQCSISDRAASLPDELSFCEVFDLCCMASSCSDSPFDLMNAAVVAAQLAGVCLDCDISSFSRLNTPLGYVCTCGLYSASMVALAMLARKYSKYRRMSVFATCDGYPGSISVKFELYQTPPDKLKKHIAAHSNCFGVPVCISEKDGVFLFDISPYRLDVGFFGVKDGGIPFVYK